MGKHEVGDTAALCEKESTLVRMKNEVVELLGFGVSASSGLTVEHSLNP